MKQFFFNLLVVTVAIFGIASAETLVELCQDVCTNAGDYLNQYQADMPECAQKFLNEKGYLGKQWSCEDVRNVVLDLGQRAAECKEDGREDEFGNCVQETLENILTEERIEEFRGKTNDECKQKFYEIVEYVAQEVGEV